MLTIHPLAYRAGQRDEATTTSPHTIVGSLVLNKELGAGTTGKATHYTMAWVSGAFWLTTDTTLFKHGCIGYVTHLCSGKLQTRHHRPR
jgi:hypothetical protein